MHAEYFCVQPPKHQELSADILLENLVGENHQER